MRVALFHLLDGLTGREGLKGCLLHSLSKMFLQSEHDLCFKFFFGGASCK